MFNFDLCGCAAEVFDEYLKSIKQKVCALKEAFAIGYM